MTRLQAGCRFVISACLESKLWTLLASGEIESQNTTVLHRHALATHLLVFKLLNALLLVNDGHVLIFNHKLKVLVAPILLTGSLSTRID